ncbi:tetratricopeptide repeat protein [candidate division KSB1 bacterium]|nr:tetratricopeptide repeat protein [candidate division KSB1 bacterium]
MHQYLYDYYLRTLSPTETEQFEVHLIQCRKCQEEMARLDRAFKVMQQDHVYYRELIHSRPISVSPIPPRKQVVKLAIAFTFLLIVGGGLFSYFTLPPYFDLARLTDETALMTLKGESGTGEFEAALCDFRRKDYVASISHFKKFLEKQPTHYQAHYFLGLAGLAAGETNWLGYHRFSDARTRESIFYLERAYQLAGDNLFYQENCLWLLGKAWLRLGDREQAMASWQKILEIASPDLVYKIRAEKNLEELK